LGTGGILKKVEEYLSHAAECRDMARTASATHRQQLQQMAETWEQLAEGTQAPITQTRASGWKRCDWIYLARDRSKRKAVVVMSSAVKDRAERLFRQQQEGTKAFSEYQAKEQATRLLTAKLRAERLAREAIREKPKSKR
jgi:glycyl-tRNA synthetase beta subunit